MSYRFYPTRVVEISRLSMIYRLVRYHGRLRQLNFSYFYISILYQAVVLTSSIFFVYTLFSLIFTIVELHGVGSGLRCQEVAICIQRFENDNK